MIGGAADFQKWLAIFNVVSGSSGPPPPFLIPPGGRYIPTISIVSGLSAANVILAPAPDGQPMASFVGNYKFPGGEIDTTVRLLVTTNGSGGLCQLIISNPVNANFTSAGQAQILGLPSIVQSPGAIGNTGGGWNSNLTAITTSNAGVLFSFEASQINTDYYVDVSWKYEIQTL